MLLPQEVIEEVQDIFSPEGGRLSDSEIAEIVSRLLNFALVVK